MSKQSELDKSTDRLKTLIMRISSWLSDSKIKN